MERLAFFAVLACLATSVVAEPLTTTQIAIAQISLWFPVVMIVVTLVTIISIGGMDYQTDTLLFQKSKDD
ncbi:hypothetical protein T484DRAFT_1925003 [Baffinella frigidus]|nr:hypothetical protein T484DRAFT_1925003 [Cryptophyta sp. CCMP2293]